MNNNLFFSTIIFIAIVIFENQLLQATAMNDRDFAEVISGPKSIHVTQTLTSRKGGRIRLRRKKVGKKFYSNPVKSRSSSRSFGDTKEIYQICKASQIINGIYLLIIIRKQYAF